MERTGEIRKSTPTGAKPNKLTREMLFLAEQAAEGKIKVLPGKEWALHYPVSPEVRAEKLQGLHEGRYTAEEVAHDIQPDALFYDVDDIEKQGLEQVSAKIRNLSSRITHYDYSRFAKFVEQMREREIPLDDLEDVYGGITQSRIQKKLLDAYGATGRKQMEDALKVEAQELLNGALSLPRSQKVLRALKANWLTEDLHIMTPAERDQVVADLSGDERKLFEELELTYRDYVQRGDEIGYEKLVGTVKEGLPTIQKEIKKGDNSESMKDLEEELEPYMDQVGLPGTPEDSAIPPDDEDEYHTSPPMPGESQEQRKARPIFEIEPPLAGYYISGRKSYFNIATRTWSKKKQLLSYDTSIAGKDRSKISGVLDRGIKSLPIPNGYALDVSSLKFKGARPEIFRDQNGCFYLQADGPSSFSIDFLKEPQLFAGSPIPDDTSLLYRGSLSVKTETAISRLMGTPLQKAEQARQFILANHFYPGGGDLQMAQALQHKLRTESSGDNYLQNLDASEYLECYSANTKFIAMMRKSGVPARLVVGHKVEGSEKGKSVITQSTGHAWSEIWDGAAWRRYDATPNPKPEDKKESEDKESKDQAKEAEDGGIDKPQDQEKPEGKSKGKGEPKESGNPTDQMSDASDADMQKAENQMQEAKEQMDRISKQKQQLDEKVQNADKFKELAELEKEIEKSDLFDDLKEDLKDKLEAKEKEMKDAIKETLDEMVEDGFMDEKQREKIEREMEEKKLEELDKVQRGVEQENRLFNEYEDIREEVRPLVEKWFKYFAERLPRHEDVSFDEDSLNRQGAFNRRSVMKTRNLLFGMVKNPREIKPSIKPRFMASILVDVSRSMDEGAGEKLKSARKLLIFYSELFSRISQVFGYIRSSINIFSDSVTEIKKFNQDYDSPQRYDFEDGTRSTVKLRLMQKLVTQGGTNMLDGIKKAAQDLNEESAEYPDYASAFYFTGDGGDTRGNAANIREFLRMNETERGFGEHMYSAILIGDESQRQELANIFGDEHTNVAPDLDSLIERSMEKFEDDLEEYLKTKTQ